MVNIAHACRLQMKYPIYSEHETIVEILCFEKVCQTAVSLQVENVDDTFCRFIGGADMGSERSDDGLQLSIIQFGTARCGPWLGFRAGCAKDRLSSSVQRFLDVEPIEDLS